MTDATLSIENLTVERGGRTVLRDICLVLAPGEIVALLGANGAGKSSLIMTIAGAVPPRAGTVRIGAQRLTGLPAHAIRRMGVAAVSEGHPVLTGLTVEDNLRAASLMHPRAEADKQIAAALETFPELKERFHVGAQHLSGGQKQMVNIAQGLISRPRYLLIDELSFGLAPAILVRLGEIIRGIASSGVGVLLVEQFTTLALSLAQRAYVMERGEIAYEGPAAHLAKNPEILHGAYLAGAGNARSEPRAP